MAVEKCTRTQENSPRPQMDEICASCSHKFAEHFTVYNNTKIGCAHLEVSSYSTGGPCSCNGFKIMFKWEHDVTICDVWQAEK